MKKLIFTILIALFAMYAKATEPLDKLPAIVIDTIYVSSGALVVEYEVLRPFDQVSLSVQSNWEQESRNVKPVSLSGSIGKGRTSIPVSLKIDKVTQFNVSLSGGQFANQGDTADYQPNAYDYAIFRKQNDGTVVQYRTQYTEEEKTMMAERIENIFIFPCKYV